MLTGLKASFQSLASRGRRAKTVAGGPRREAMTRNVFEEPWNVVVDGREGRLAVGDPVEADGCCGVVRARHTRSGVYIVDKGGGAQCEVSAKDVRLDKTRVTAL